MDLQKTSLHQLHIDLKAKMAPFAGFDMPLQYSSVKDEVLAVREGSGVFDVSHMGEFIVEGVDAVDFVDSIVTNDFKGATLKKAVYSPLCRHDGTVIDDLIAYKLEVDKVLICVNASNIEKDWLWIKSQSVGRNLTIENHSSDYSLLAVQGPKTESIFKDLGLIGEEDFPYYSIKTISYQNEKLLIARTGYTGEDGFEVFSSHEFAKNFWTMLLEIGVKPCGLAARDVLRLEACYPLYGHELSDAVTPIDAGLQWTVAQNKSDYIGKMALLLNKPMYQLVKLSLDKGIPREGYEVTNSLGEVVGKITSGTMSVVTGKGIAMALVNKELDLDKGLFVNIRNASYQAKVHKKAFIKGGHK